MEVGFGLVSFIFLVICFLIYFSIYPLVPIALHLLILVYHVSSSLILTPPAARESETARICSRLVLTSSTLDRGDCPRTTFISVLPPLLFLSYLYQT